MPSKRLLVTWIGQADLNAMAATLPADEQAKVKALDHLGSLASLANVNFNVAGPGETITLASLTSYVSANITVSSGGVLTLPGITSYTGNTTTTLGFQLYQDTGRSVIWGNTQGTNTVGGTGTGSAQPITVYGQVPAQATPKPDTYQSTVTATVYF